MSTNHHRHIPRFVWVWLASITAVLALAAGMGAASVLPADATPPHAKVTICHNGHTITVADDGYWNGHIHHLGDTLGPCPTPEPTEEPTPWPTTTPTADPTPSSSPSPEPSASVSATPTPSSPSPEPSVSEPATPVTPSPTTSPSPSASDSPTSSPTSSPVPSVTSTPSLVLPVLPQSKTSSVPYTPPTELAATGMSDGTRAALGLVVAFVVAGAFLKIVSRKRGL